MESKKECVICIYSVGIYNHMFSRIERINKSKESPFYYKLYYIPVTNEEAISKCIKYVKEEGKDCVLALGETSSYVCTVINERLGYPSPSPLSNIVCRNKYQTRMLVSEFEWYYGFNIGDPVDVVVQNVKTFPCMLKPTMLFGARAAFRCNDEASLRTKLQDISADKALLDCVQSLQSEVLPTLDQKDSSKNVQCNTMVEKFIEKNGTGIYEYYMEVFVTKEGKVIPYSLAETCSFQNGMCIGCVIPPIHFDGDVKPFEDYAVHIGDKLFRIGFRNHVFMIEFWRFPDGNFHIMEINPRLSTSFADIHEQYSGNNIFNDVANLFLHNKEPTCTPFSVLKNSLTTNTHEEQYVICIDFSSRATGLVSSIFNFDLLEDLSEEGYSLSFFVDRDCVFTEAAKAILGNPIAYLTIKGTWNEIVKKEKSLREKLYMVLSDCFKYPRYFTEK